MKKKVVLGLVIILILITIVIVVKFSYKYTDNSLGSKVDYLEENKDEIYVVPTMKDTIKENSSWCATFQLVWNDMQNNLVGGDVILSEPHEFVNNLNLQSFKEADLSEESYYKKWGLVSTDLKEEIEKGIKDKFDEESDILDGFDWTEEPYKYLFYTMLKKEFEFPKEFDILENEKFKDTENVKYFGIKDSTDSQVRNQVTVLYYESKSDFAVKLSTKTNDEVILARKDDSSNFEDIYNNILRKSESFEGDTKFGDKDILKVPNLDMDILKEYNEVTGKEFLDKNGNPNYIDKAVQTIQMELDNKGGKIKSEAAIVTKMSAMAPVIEKEPREFLFNDDYVIFLKETDKDLPYFAACINDINLFVDEETAE